MAIAGVVVVVVVSAVNVFVYNKIFDHFEWAQSLCAAASKHRYEQILCSLTTLSKNGRNCKRQ